MSSGGIITAVITHETLPAARLHCVVRFLIGPVALGLGTPAVELKRQESKLYLLHDESQEGLLGARWRGKAMTAGSKERLLQETDSSDILPLASTHCSSVMKHWFSTASTFTVMSSAISE